MIARHDGQVVLVSGTIPGERVVATVTRADRQVAYATVVDVLEPHSDRREWRGDWTCGGASYAFIAYPRQIALKAEVVADAFARIGRLTLPTPIEVAPSEERGYRLRARLHVHEGRIGFYREATHELCDPRSTGQLAEVTYRVLDQIRMKLKKIDAAPVSAIELSENAAGTERVVHLQLRPGPGLRTPTFAPIAGIRGLTGATCAVSTGAPTVRLGGDPHVHDVIGSEGAAGGPARLQRHVRSFFQGNRFLLHTLADAVGSAVTAQPDEEVLDLYAGVGLFAVALAASGLQRVVAVEGDRSSAEDLRANAVPFEGRMNAFHMPVEEYLRLRPGPPAATIIVDPPRTGLSREACDAAIAQGARQIVYVSCDVATLARDARRLVDAGYALTSVRAFDLFPNTPHVETLAIFVRA